MADETLSFTSSVDLPDGCHIYVSIEIPAAKASGLPHDELVDYPELAQMGVSTLLNGLLRADAARKQVPF